MAEQSVIFVPGFMCDERLFRPQAAFFSALGWNVQVANTQCAHSIGDMARQLIRDAPDSFALCGLSMGGIVALEVMQQAPEKVEALALLNTTPLADQSAEQRIAHIGRVDEELMSIIQDELKPRYLSATNNDPEIVRCILAMARDLGPDTFKRQSEALLNRADMRCMLQQIDCPTLVLAGADDQVCTADLHRAMAGAIPGSRLVIVNNCGHLSTLESPETVNQALYSVFSRTGSNRPQGG